MFKEIPNFKYPSDINKCNINDMPNLELVKYIYDNEFIDNIIYNKTNSGFIVNNKPFVIDPELIKNLDEDTFNYIFNNINFGLQKISRKYIPDYEKDLIFGYVNNNIKKDLNIIPNTDPIFYKTLLKKRKQSIIINRWLCVKLFNYAYHNSELSYNKKYLLFARKFPFEFRYKIYLLCCRYGDQMYDLLNKYPYLIFRLIKNPILTFSKHIENIHPKNILYVKDLFNRNIDINLEFNYTQKKQQILLRVIYSYIEHDFNIDINIVFNKISKLLPVFLNDHKLYLKFYRINDKSIRKLIIFIYELIDNYDIATPIDKFFDNYLDYLQFKELSKPNKRLSF